MEGVDSVRWVSCSFPSVARHAPAMELVEWKGLHESLWSVDWQPPWEVEVCVDGSNWISCTALLRIRGLTVRGELSLAFSPNLTEATACFTSLPAVELEPECTVSWGALPLGGPVGDTLENAILDMVPPKVLEMVKAEWTAPNAVTVCLVDKGFWSRFEGAAESRAVRTSCPRPDRLLNAPACVQEEAAGLAARRLAAEVG